MLSYIFMSYALIYEIFPILYKLKILKFFSLSTNVEI